MSFDVCFDGTPAAPHVAPPLVIGRGTATDATIVAHGADSPQRAQLEDFVRREFLAHFGARIKQFMPELLALQWRRPHDPRRRRMPRRGD